jgi:uncharacterized membrane protein
MELFARMPDDAGVCFAQEVRCAHASMLGGRMNRSTSTRDPRLLALTLVLVPIAVYFLAKHALPRLEMTEAVYGEYYWPRRFWLFAHTIAGLLATVLGPLQFVRALREAHPALHRFTGKVYLAAVLIAASCALVLATTSQISASYEWGLILGASLWLMTGALAYTAARRHRFAQHRAWMVRNYTVTFFFITFFVAFDVAQLAGWGDVTVLAGPLVFGCLFIPLLAVEAALRIVPRAKLDGRRT